MHTMFSDLEWFLQWDKKREKESWKGGKNNAGKWLIHTLFSPSRCHSQTEGNQYSRSFLNTQTEALAHSRERLTLAEVPCTRLDQGTAFPPPSHRACSVPIIPSVQASNPEARAEDRSTMVLRYKDGASASQTMNSEAEIGSLSNCSQGPPAPGNQTKHKSLVTYTTVLGPRTESAMTKTVVSITILASGKERVHHSPNVSKSSGRLEHQHVQSTHEEREQEGAALHNTLIRRDCHLSTEPNGLSSLTVSKSWLDKIIGLKNYTNTKTVKLESKKVYSFALTPLLLAQDLLSKLCNCIVDYSKNLPWQNSEHWIPENTMWINYKMI